MQEIYDKYNPKGHNKVKKTCMTHTMLANNKIFILQLSANPNPATIMHTNVTEEEIKEN